MTHRASLKGADEAVSTTMPVRSHVNPWATAHRRRSGQRIGQTVSFVIDSNSAPAHFRGRPALSSAGVLTYTPGTVATGHDDGDDHAARHGQRRHRQWRHRYLASAIVHDRDHARQRSTDADQSRDHLCHRRQYPVACGRCHHCGSRRDHRCAGRTGQVAADRPGWSVGTERGRGQRGERQRRQFRDRRRRPFTYVPPAGFAGTDSFTFQVTDSNTPTPGIAVGTASITVGPTIWYVSNLIDANNPAGGDGRSTNAFDKLAGAQAASGNGDIIFVFRGASARPAYAAASCSRMASASGARATDSTVAPFGALVAGRARSRASTRQRTRSSVPATAGNRVGVEIRGLDLQGNANAIDVTATGANNVGVTDQRQYGQRRDRRRHRRQLRFDRHASRSRFRTIRSPRAAPASTSRARPARARSRRSMATRSTAIPAAPASSSAVPSSMRRPGNPIETVNGGATTIGAIGNGVGGSAA